MISAHQTSSLGRLQTNLGDCFRLHMLHCHQAVNPHRRRTFVAMGMHDMKICLQAVNAVCPPAGLTASGGQLRCCKHTTTRRRVDDSAACIANENAQVV